MRSHQVDHLHHFIFDLRFYLLNFLFLFFFFFPLFFELTLRTRVTFKVAVQGIEAKIFHILDRFAFWIIWSFEVDKSLNCDHPCPFLGGIFGHKMQNILGAFDFETCWSQIILLFHIRLHSNDFLNLYNISHFLQLFIGEREHKIRSQDNPSFSPLLQELGSFLQVPFQHEVFLYFCLYWFLIHDIIIAHH